MASAAFPNIYTHRKVAEASSKACDICYKPSSSVLITPDKKDFFFVCPAHLKDRHFCTPKIDEEAVKAKREKELEAEKIRLVKEYEDKQRLKKEKEAKDKDKDKKDDDPDNDNKDKSPVEDGQKEKATSPTTEVNDESVTPSEDEPRVFELLSIKRQAEFKKRDRERASQPDYFPSVPTDLPGRGP